MRSLARYEHPILAKSLLQLATSIGLFVAACAAMYWALQFSYLLSLALALPAGALLVRVFIVQHDCGHGAFFASRRANDAVGMVCSLMTLTPYANWQRQHARHHGNWNNLDRRQSGADIYAACLTLKEYRTLPARHRFVYRLTRHPIVAHLLVPPLVFAVLYRTPFDTPSAWHRERRSVYLTNAALVVLFGTLGRLLGYEQVLLVQGPVILVGSIVGVWLFAVQHRFETALWARRTNGISPPPLATARPTSGCRRRCSGSPATSAATTFITWPRACRTIASRSATMHCRRGASCRRCRCGPP
jgi:omega-6 fatty acid desaturase (delta-12 desaturase)